MTESAKLVEAQKLLSPDPNFNGFKPAKERGWHDIIFAVGFIAVFAGMVVVSLIAFQRGKPSVLVPSYLVDHSKEHVSGMQDAVAQIKADKNALLGAGALAIILGFVWVQLLKMFTRLFIYLTIACGISFVLIVAVVLLGMGSERNNSGMMYAGYIAIGIAFLLFVTAVFLRKRIDITAMMMEESCRGIQHNTPGIFIVSGSVVLAYVLVVLWFSATLVYLYSIPKAHPHEEGVDGAAVSGAAEPSVPSYNPEDFDKNIRNVILFQVFGFFWTSAWLAAVSEMVIAGGVASWYFSRSTGQRETLSPTTTSLRLAVTKSLGSLAFGALILAVVRFINYLLDRVRKANEKSGGNKIISFLVACVQCCLGCVERLIKYLSKYAYIYIAMYGDSFCTAADNVYHLMSRNALTLVLADMIAGWVLLIGKLVGCCACVLLTSAATGGHTSPLSLAIIAVGSFFVFHLYSLVIHMGMDTVFVCYMEDLERNRDSQRYYMTPATHETLQAASAAKSVQN